jgi:predicted nicotinamide N-methyase
MKIDQKQQQQKPSLLVMQNRPKIMIPSSPPPQKQQNNFLFTTKQQKTKTCCQQSVNEMSFQAQKPKKWSPTQQQLLAKRSVVVDGITVFIEQDIVANQDGEANVNRGRPDVCEVGKVLWPGSVFLIEYLNFITKDWDSVDVLELGCGPGLVGIYLGLRGAKCVLTDLDNVVELAQRNVEHNFKDIESRSSYGLAPTVVCYDWNAEEADISQDLRKSFDFIVASEVLYEKCNFEALLQVIDRHSTDTTRVYMSYQIRTGGEFEYCKETLSALGFSVGLVESDQLPPR